MKNKKTAILLICCGAVLALLLFVTAAVMGLGFYAFSQQYNADGISSSLCITIDESQPMEYIGELDDHSIYVEGLQTDALYFISASAANISLRDAVAEELVSLKDWRNKAWKIVKTDELEILLYENYEIAITDEDCIIRPITQ